MLLLFFMFFVFHFRCFHLNWISSIVCYRQWSKRVVKTIEKMEKEAAAAVAKVKKQIKKETKTCIKTNTRTDVLKPLRKRNDKWKERDRLKEEDVFFLFCVAKHLMIVILDATASYSTISSSFTTYFLLLGVPLFLYCIVILFGRAFALYLSIPSHFCLLLSWNNENMFSP